MLAILKVVLSISESLRGNNMYLYVDLREQMPWATPSGTLTMNIRTVVVTLTAGEYLGINSI